MEKETVVIKIEGHLASILDEIAMTYALTAQEYVEDVLLEEIAKWVKEHSN